MYYEGKTNCYENTCSRTDWSGYKMIILKIKNNAGPGNQMFMYARAYSLARKFNQKIIIISEISGYSTRQNILQKLSLDKTIVKAFIRLDWTRNQYVFRFFRKIIFDVLLKLPCFKQINQRNQESRIFQPLKEELKKGKIYVIDGYWECHNYFDEYRDALIRQLVPNYVLPQEVKKMAERVGEENSVVLHIRRGDFSHFGRLINDDYYEYALEKIKSLIKVDKIYVLTEDTDLALEWKKKYNAQRIIFDTPTKYIDEWYVMSKCKYHIIANSTYSWWSSYLSNDINKKIIIPNLSDYLLAEKGNDAQMYKNYYKISDTICIL